MSSAAAAATASLSSISSNPTSFPHSRTRRIKTEFLLSKKSIVIRIFSSSSSVLRNTTTTTSSSSSVLRNTTTTTTYGGARRRRRVDRNPGIKPSFIPVMQWQDCSAKMEVDVPCSVAYKCYSDRETIPRWMPFISSVKIVADKPDLSLWSLKYKAFGQDIEFSWLARNLQPIPNQKIHWRSLEGLPNRGVVRFYPKGPSSCVVDLTVSYEVPQILTPVASALKPFLESLLLNGLERFTKVAKSYPQV